MEAKLVKDLMEAYASVYAQPEEVIAESDCECEDEEKSEKETPEMNDKKKGKKEKEDEMKEEVETDLFDIILEYLVAEGYADTNQSALVIMANMSEDWKQNIVETIAGGGYTPNPVGNAIRTGAGLLQKAMSNPSVKGAIKTGSQMLQKRAPSGGYSTRPGDGKPYADGPLWGPGSGSTPKTPVKKPVPTGGYSTRPGDGKPYADGPLF